MTEKATYTVPQPLMERLQEKVDALNKRARRLDLAELKIVEHSRTRLEVDETGVGFDLVTLTIDGQTPRLNGWQFAATIDHVADGINIVRALAEQEPPKRFRTVAKGCDHCEKNRSRKDTYIVHNPDTGEWKQVGRTCLKDFTGHKSAERVANFLESLQELLTSLLEDGFTIDDALEAMFATEAFGGHREGGDWLYWKLDVFLRYTVRAVKAFGWMSRGKAREYGGAATADIVGHTLVDLARGRKQYIAPEMLKPQPNEKEIADGAIEWLTGLDQNSDDLDSSYMWGIWVIAQAGQVTWREFGFAASIVNAYLRHNEQEIERQRKQETSAGYFGEIKKRYTFENLELVWETSWESQYGVTYLYKFTDVDGHVFVWKTGRADLYVGHSYTGKATVKAHDEYNGEMQTVLTRASLEDLGGDEPEEGPCPNCSAMVEIDDGRFECVECGVTGECYYPINDPVLF